MSPRTLLARASAMDAEEFRSRFTSAVRTRIGRARFAVARPRWRRNRLLAVLDPSSGPYVRDALSASRRGDWAAAHAALARHLQSRESRWPLNAAQKACLSAEITQAFPDARDNARRAAERVLEGHLDLLGYGAVATGDPPAWHRDPIHGRHAPCRHWSSVPYLDPAIGDHKIIWEINRHQHFLTLGTAYWLTGDERYRYSFVRQLEDWLRQNPPDTGINWASMLELAFRTMSWAWAVEFFSPAADENSSPWLVDLLVGLDAQLSHIASNLSTYFSPNTHLSGEALALYAVSTAFPEFRRSAARAAAGRDILLREAKRQVLGDGGHAELSAHYHRYSTDFYLLACLVARPATDQASPAFERAAHRQASYLRTIADDEGRLPLLGDDDGGRLFKFAARPAWDASATLSLAAEVLSDPSLAVGPATAELFWILGRRPERLQREARPMAWPSRLLGHSGYFVSRSAGGNHLVFDAGPHGYLNGGHAHSDALSVVLTVRGRPLLIDAGTATYTMDRAVRDGHRAARMHNTIMIDDCDPSTPAGPFHWRSRADARVLVARTGREFDFAAGALRRRAAEHVRAVLALHGTGWLIVDRILAPTTVTADVWWHVHPTWSVRGVAGGVTAESRDGIRLGMGFSRGEAFITQDPDVAAVSFEYGTREIGTAVRVRHRGVGGFAMACFIPESPAASALEISQIRSRLAVTPGWTAVAFFIRAEPALHLSVELQFPDRGSEPDERWPQPCIYTGRPEDMTVCAE